MKAIKKMGQLNDVTTGNNHDQRYHRYISKKHKSYLLSDLKGTIKRTFWRNFGPLNNFNLMLAFDLVTDFCFSASLPPVCKYECTDT